MQMGLDQKTLQRTVSYWGEIRWDPKWDTLVVFISYLLVVSGLFTAFQVFTTEHVAANFITFGPVTLVGLGVALPIGYTVLVSRHSLAELGITNRRLMPSILLSAILGWVTYSNTLADLDVNWNIQAVPLVIMVIAVGLFEAIFFRGWLQLRFEKAFGLVPGLILGALCYSLYHIGYGMEPDDLLFLFGLGFTFGAVFRLTKNIFILWPLYTPIGSLYTNINEGLKLPFDATYGFLLTIGLMVGVILFAIIMQNRTAENPGKEQVNV